MSNERLILKPQVTVVNFDEESASKIISNLEQIVDFYGPAQPILVNIDSNGGEVFGLTAIYEKLKSMVNPIVTYNSSKAISAGAILLSAGGTPGMRIASPNSTTVIHELQTGLWQRDIKDIENDLEHIQSLNERWMGILAKSMGLSSSDQIRDLFSLAKGRELYLDANGAKEIGLVDDVCYLSMLPPQSIWEIVKLPPLPTIPLPVVETKKKKPRKK
jgi:ATP-dependent Clp protease protease subunit